MPRDYNIYLKDILESIARIEEYSRGLSTESLAKDRMKEDAIVRNLITIGEAAKSIPGEIRSKAPSTEWDEIAGLRDVLIHRYFGTDPSILIDIIENDLPKLKRSIQGLVKR